MIARPITTTDLLKFAALAFVLIDHTGAYFVDDETWWRLIGRLAAPIFFFLIGFARARAVPWTWLAFGLVLTLSDAVGSESLAEPTLNILLNFALLRGAVLPAIERWVWPSLWPIALLTAACVAAIPFTDHVLEYGTGGWLWALFGLAHRRALDDPEPHRLWTRTGLAAAIGIAYTLREIHDFDFDSAQSAVLAALVAGLVVLLARFRREPFAWQAPRPVGGLLSFCGRHSLEIYAVSLFAMQVVAYGIDAAEEDDGAS